MILKSLIQPDLYMSEWQLSSSLYPRRLALSPAKKTHRRTQLDLHDCKLLSAGFFKAIGPLTLDLDPRKKLI